MHTVEVYADITCPFAHVGLKRVTQHVHEMAEPVDVIVRAWPLEWVNGSPLAVEAVLVKGAALTDQLGVDDFSGLRSDAWPASTIPALNLTATGYERDPATGLAVGLDLRAAVFERGEDVGDSDVLAQIAAAHGLPAP
jgi:predicted DsbA family dithiol-disulfide isomerase